MHPGKFLISNYGFCFEKLDTLDHALLDDEF